MTTFKFKKNAIIGAADAEDDAHYLQTSFVDTGALTILRDCDDQRRIVLGRTGSGKTALLNRLEDSEDNVIRIPPESLSLSYISNSNILNFFTKAGVKLDIFYRLLWRHVLTVELLKTKYKINDEGAKKSFISQMMTLFRSDKKKQNTIDYLVKWGETFWEETEYRIKEVTTRLETDLKSSIEGKIPVASLSVQGTEKLTEEEKAEIVERAQTVVNKVQIRQLSDIIELLAKDVLNDHNQKYFIIIDRLDENWVEDNLRYRLIRALIETARDFRKVKCLKVVIALRTDLVERVFKLTRDAGFQEEKYESLYLNLAWDKKNLVDLLDRRIDLLVKEQYTTKIVTHRDILPKQIGNKPSIDYVLERTMMRPRDIILFLNTCLSYAEGKATVNKENMLDAEGEYSRARLRALADEWYADYPDLIDFAMILKKSPSAFFIEQLEASTLENFCLEQVTQKDKELKGIVYYANELLENRLGLSDLKRILFGIFYKVGLVGLKIDPHAKTSWTYEGARPAVSSPEITENTKVYIHPGVWRVFGIHDRR